MIISMDYESGSFNGVKQINIIDWLLGKWFSKWILKNEPLNL
jgi:hypothetical protein